MGFREVDVQELEINPATLFAQRWALLTAGSKDDGFNAMTIAWGTIGSLWDMRGNREWRHGHPVVTVYVRPQRYTKELLDREELFTISFPPEGDKRSRRALGWMGTHSGRDSNKFEETGLVPAFGYGTTYVEGAELVLVCHKLYAAPLTEEGFINREVMEQNYPDRDFHTMFVGHIERVLVGDVSVQGQ